MTDLTDYNRWLEYAVSARYPDDFGDKRTLEDAMEAYHCIKEVEKELLFL